VPTATLPDSLEGIAAGYVSLIRRVQPQGPYELMGWCVAGALSFEIARQLEEQHHEVANLFLIDSWVPRYFERQSKWLGIVGDYSLRWQQVAEDWQRFRRGQQTLSKFFANRETVKKIKALFEHPRIKFEEAARPRDSGLETYDTWLLGYLQKLTRNYEPKKIGAGLTIIRSREEPTGWFFKEDAGWRGYTSKSATVVYVDGNHYTMFADPGVTQLASHIASALDAPR
jgi:thioesterase domain-containing protein